MTTAATVANLQCKRCRKIVPATPYRLEAGQGKYCGALCAKKVLEEAPPRTVKQQAFAENPPTSWWANCSRAEFADRLASNRFRMSVQAPAVKVPTLPE